MILSLGSFAGCGSVNSESDFAQVREDIGSRTGDTVQWRGVSADEAAVDRAVRHLLDHRLTADTTVELALLNNHQLQATYEDLGIGRADLVQAGLLKNPIFSAGIRLPDRSPKKTYLDLSIEDDLIDLLLISARKRIAESQFMTVKATVTDRVLQFAADTRKSFYDYQYAVQELELRKTVLQVESAAYTMARRLHEAGNTNDLALLETQTHLQASQMGVTSAEESVVEARERLNELMGLSDAQLAWESDPQLVALPDSDVDLSRLQTLAGQNRADLRAAQYEVDSAAKVLGFTDSTRLFGSTSIGAEGERETDGQWRIGPVVNVPIPLFDQGQAAVARATSQLRQSRQRFVALETEIRSQVRSARGRMTNARQRAEYYLHEVLPTQKKLLTQMQLQYNGMVVGVFQFLQAKRDQVEAGHDYLSALRDYWVGRTDLERAIGRRLPAPADSTTKVASQPATRAEK